MICVISIVLGVAIILGVLGGMAVVGQLERERDHNQ